MATSLTPTFSEIRNGEVPSPAARAYFAQRLRNRVHQLLLDTFVEREKECGGDLTRADIARYSGKKPEQVTRWFGEPSNWTLETLSALFLSLGVELNVGVSDVASALNRAPAGAENPLRSVPAQESDHPIPRPQPRDGEVPAGQIPRPHEQNLTNLIVPTPRKAA
jgi:hypothetical protein